MERMPVQSAEEFAEELHAEWKQQMSDRNAGNFGDTDDYFYVRRSRMMVRAKTFYLYADQSGFVENGNRCREDSDSSKESQ